VGKSFPANPKALLVSFVVFDNAVEALAIITALLFKVLCASCKIISRLSLLSFP